MFIEASALNPTGTPEGQDVDRQLPQRVIQGPDFALLGGEHLLALALILALAWIVGRVAPRDHRFRLAWVMVVLLIAQEVVKLYFFVGVYDQSWKQSLPLDLCRVNQFLCVYMLVRHSYRVFEVAYFWAMGG